MHEAYKNITLTQFLERLTQPQSVWMIKRLSGNDTGITGGHQSGLYIPRVFMASLFPEVVTTRDYNPTKTVECYIPSHDCLKKNVQVKYYNSKFFPERGLQKAYNEFRMTRWTNTPLQQDESTGSICVLAGVKTNGVLDFLCWVSRTAQEEDLIEDWIGREIEPGCIYTSRTLTDSKPSATSKKVPLAWLSAFPSGHEIVDFVERQFPQETWGRTIDELLIKRRTVEFEVFSELERHEVLPHIKKGFTSVDDFIKYAMRIVNRRKSRSGTSLELQLERIFRYEKLQFETQAVTEQNKKPDFLFPSAQAYHNPVFPQFRLHMLASKTCCKDRWRQVINEADRIREKHLFTLQEGISSNQLKEMYHHGIVVVVPRPIMSSFPKEYRQQIMDLTGFVALIKAKQS